MDSVRLCDDKCVSFSDKAEKPCLVLNTIGDIASSLRTIARSTEGPVSGSQFPPGGPR